MSSLTKALARLAVVATTAAAGAVVVAAPAHAYASYVHLAVDNPDPVVGEEVTFTATTDYSINFGTRIRIGEVDGPDVTNCTSLPCQGDESRSTAGTVTFEAVVHDYSPFVERARVTLTVTWHDPVTECKPVPPPAVLCITSGREARRVSLYAGPVVSAPRAIAGYVDEYQFTVAGATVVLACPVLVNGTSEINPCKTAGGTFVARMATLIDVESWQDEPVEPLVTVGVCNATLTLTVAGVGVSSAPIYQLC